MFDKQFTLDATNRQNVSVEKEQEQRSEITFVGKIIPHRGHTLFEIVDKTGEIRFPDYLKQDFRFDPNWRPGDQIKAEFSVLVKQGCSYVSALNKGNAIKKWRKGDTGSRIDVQKMYPELIDF